MEERFGRVQSCFVFDLVGRGGELRLGRGLWGVSGRTNFSNPLSA